MEAGSNARHIRKATMKVEQLSIFLENKAGRLAQVTKTLAEAGINIRALSLADTSDFGILRLIVDKPDEAEKALKSMGLTVRLTDVIAIEISDTPGGFASALNVLKDRDVEIEYAYAFISRDEGRACVILRVDDNDKAIKLFGENGVKILPGSNIYTM